MRRRWSIATISGLCGLLVACGTPPVRAVPPSYTVAAGDTVYAIAKRYRVTVSALLSENHLGSDFRIYPGQVLRIPAADRAGTATAPAANANANPNTAASVVPGMRFRVPTAGHYVATTRPNGGRGVLFNGQSGQAITAAAPGRVVYRGTGLLGYGQLLIIKHDDHYLTAYGHLAQTRVMEGMSVVAGQPIASMGFGPQGQAQLYFEIRLNGRPVDPVNLFSAE